MNVNITALMDVLTVLLFFLIKSFTVSSSSLTPPDAIALPESHEALPSQEAVVVSISKFDLRADNEILLKIQRGRFLASDVGDDRRMLLPLEKYLRKQHQKKMAVYEGVGDVNALPPGKLLIQADKNLPFGLLKYVFYTASSTGYADYQFVIVSDQ